jgi:hypothetical protein
MDDIKAMATGYLCTEQKVYLKSCILFSHQFAPLLFCFVLNQTLLEGLQFAPHNELCCDKT